MSAFPDAQEVLQPHPTFIPTDEGGILAELFGCRVGALHREQRGGGKPPPTGGWKQERYFVFGGLTDRRKHVEWHKVSEAVDSLCSELQTLDRIRKKSGLILNTRPRRTSACELRRVRRNHLSPKPLPWTICFISCIIWCKNYFH